MLFHVPGVLTAAEAVKIRDVLSAGDLIEGAKSAGQLAATVKHNEEFAESNAQRQQLERQVAEAVQRHPLVQRHALPLRISHPIFARYLPGMHYGRHTDDAVMGLGGYRSDLAMTVFLSDPEDYQGGSLVVEFPEGEQAARHSCGDAVLYPADRLHRVEEVTQGERWVAVLWIQSQVRDAQHREILSTLDALRTQGMATSMDAEALLQLDWLYARLLRMWADV